MTGSRLHIGRLATRYLVARGHPDPDALAARLDAAGRGLPGQLAACLAPHADDASEAVWLLRQVAVELTLDGGANPDALAAQWGQTVARATLRGLDPNADGVVMFADRAAWLAAFLRDLAGGDAWSLWYYAAFDGLRALPIAAALRTALLADPQEGRRALLYLEPWHAAHVIAALGSTEATHVMAGLTADGAGEPPPPAAVLAAWQAAPHFGLCPARLALACWLAILRAAPLAGGPGAAATARALATLRLAMVHGVRGLEALLDAGDLPALYRRLAPAEAERLQPLLHLPKATRRALAAAPARADDAPATRDTAYGGLFLLLPHLDPPDSGAPLLSCFLALAACAGDEASAVLLDPLWRDLFRAPDDMFLADFAPHAATARAVLSRFAFRLLGFAQSSPDYLRRNFLACRARVTFAPECITVVLGRPPLDLVLGLAGIGRGRLDLPWLDARPIAFEREG